MKNILKRLCTGFLAFAIVVTTLPSTPVHASEKQYWTESNERVGIVEKVMNDGSIGSVFNEGWFLSNAQSLVLMAIVVIGIYLGFKREFSKLIGFLVVALIAVGLVFNAGGVKDVLLELFNRIIGA